MCFPCIFIDRHELERTLIAEKARNECLIRLYVADESAEDISEECRVATEQHLDAVSFEQRSALSDLKVAMDSEYARSVRIARERSRISRALAQEEQKIERLRHDLKFRVATEELSCLLNAQIKLDDNRSQSVKHFHQRLMLELEDYIRKLRVILEIPDSFTVAVELQQCLDSLNRNIRGASQTAANSLTAVHESVTSVMLQELRNIRTGLLRAEELEEEEIGRRIDTLKEQERQILEEDEDRRRSFNNTVPLENLEVETEIHETQDKLAVERIRLQFIEDERDALTAQISEAKAEALCQGHEAELPGIIDSLKPSRGWRHRCVQAEELVRNKLQRSREAEWTSIVLDKAAADNSFTLSTMGQSGLWARGYCTSVQEGIRKQTEELKNKQAAELAAFEDGLKQSQSAKSVEIQDLKNKLELLQQRIGQQGDDPEAVEAIRREAEATQKELATLEAAAHLEAEAADVQKREFVEAQKKELLQHELKKQREFMEAQWKLSRIAKFEELRSMQLDLSSSAAAQKELLAACHEAELRDLKELHSRQRILILNQFLHQLQREAKEKFHPAKSSLTGSLSTPEHSHGSQSDEASGVAEKAASQEVDVAAEEEEEVKELKERHYTELAELVKSNETATKGPTAPVKTVQVVLPDETASGEEATIRGEGHSPDQARKTLENAPSKVVAEWQKRMRSGSCASILITKEDGADKKAAAICKHLEQFLNAVTRVQREEKDRQNKIMEEKMAKRNERRIAKGKHRRRTGSTAAKRDKYSGPRKSVLDFKAERLQTTRQKEKQMKEQWKAKRDAIEKWHPLFWSIVEEEAKHGSYEAYEDSTNVVARGPTLCNIERVINSLEEGSFLRNMIANLGILVKAFNTLGASPDIPTTDSEGSESDSSSKSSSSYRTEEPRQRRKVSADSDQESRSSDTGESSDESSDESSSEESSSEEDSTEGSSSEEGSEGHTSNESSNTSEDRRHSQTQADGPSAMTTSSKRDASPEGELAHEASSRSSTDSMDSKAAQQTKAEKDKDSSASSEKSESSSSDDSEEDSSGTSSSSSSASMSGASSESGSNSVDERSNDSSEEASSDSSSSSSSGSNAQRTHSDTEKSQAINKHGNGSESFASKGSRASQPEAAEDVDNESSSGSSGSSSASEVGLPQPSSNSSVSESSSRINVPIDNRPRQQGSSSSPNGSTSGSSGSSSSSRQSSTAGTETSSD
ncbi:hypothetical protein EPH_0048130 [Eimeria praecox]|uniref:Uncharacterized protein n=1 Tax=Eimeria praecox TaxID=51316 RepID=U6H234_9EIME|nr:hypothetical protein EPH_0048130 [Eimeria praecox]